MKHDIHITTKGRNPNGGVMIDGESLITHEGEVVFKDCNDQEYYNLKKLYSGCYIELEEYPGIKLKIIKEPKIYSENSIGLYVYSEEIK